jgi:hypothetical protein
VHQFYKLFYSGVVATFILQWCLRWTQPDEHSRMVVVVLLQRIHRCINWKAAPANSPMHQLESILHKTPRAIDHITENRQTLLRRSKKRTQIISKMEGCMLCWRIQVSGVLDFEELWAITIPLWLIDLQTTRVRPHIISFIVGFSVSRSDQRFPRLSAAIVILSCLAWLGL